MKAREVLPSSRQIKYDFPQVDSRFPRLPPRLASRTWDSGFWDDRRHAVGERCRLASAQLLRLSHAGGCSSMTQLLPSWHGHMPIGLKHQHDRRAAEGGGGGGGEETFGVGARRPLRTLFGRHGPFARRMLDGEHRVSAAVCHSACGQHPTARLLSGWPGHQPHATWHTRRRSCAVREP